MMPDHQMTEQNLTEAIHRNIERDGNISWEGMLDGYNGGSRFIAEAMKVSCTH